MKKLTLPEQGAEILFDVRDENIRLLESLFDVRISARGSSVTIEGQEEAVGSVERIFQDFSQLVSDGVEFSNGELGEAFRQIAQRSAESLRELFPRKIVVRTPVREVVPRSPNQIRYLQEIERSDLVFGIGPAGTGKTYLAVAMAISMLLRKAVRRIILARPAVEAGEKLGFLPGDMQEKVNPYLRPLYDALYDMLDAEKVQRLIDRGVIEVAPIAFMRGRTLSNSFIIMDEAQNSTSEQMKMFLTRIGLNSKTVVTGDVTQVDLPAGQKSGLIESARILKHIGDISFCHFDHRDVVRHRLVRLIIQAYEKADQ
ncbi:MAG TPA: PhoH family protein [Acidobacteriota bacterium]|nr:PhoH family protein [Acidobacteriota bacterium]